MKEITLNHITEIFVFIILLVSLNLSACAVPLETSPKETKALNEYDAKPQSTGIWDASDLGSAADETILSAHLELPERLLTGEAVNLKFTLTNTSEIPLFVLKWYTPLEGIAGKIFKVTRDGQAVPYEGILASRSIPTIDSYILIKPGESITTVVDLGMSFDFSEAGTYQIGFLSPQISHIAYSTDEIAQTDADLGPVQILSNPVTLEISDK